MRRFRSKHDARLSSLICAGSNLHGLRPSGLVVFVYGHTKGGYIARYLTYETLLQTCGCDFIRSFTGKVTVEIRLAAPSDRVNLSIRGRGSK